jgi:2-oxoglutarate dehydrogenase E1 component
MLLQTLQTTYQGNIGFEYMHITDTAQKRWLQERIEARHGELTLAPEDRRHLLERLVAARGLEHYLHTRYVGQKRFSLEGADALIPLLDDLIQSAGRASAHEVIIGMAHRGRLNVLVNILGKSPAALFSEFEGKHHRVADNWNGDVKYHQGFSSDIATPGGPVHLALAFNPSHLEIINPVVEGSVRARQQRRGDYRGIQVLPVLIHGDAAFAGQGVIMETLNLSQTRGYATGGTVHIVINNQIGFTTSDPLDARSTQYCTDVIKMVQAPIFHVNGDDPEAVLFVTRMALEYRMTFAQDVLIDMVCYRRQGHNEADSPAVTQPRMYQRIDQHPDPAEVYHRRLVNDAAIAEDQLDRISQHYRDCLDAGKQVSRPALTDYKTAFAVNWQPFIDSHWTDPADTRISRYRIQTLNGMLSRLPSGFTLHPRVARIMQDRDHMANGDAPVDWGFAETLAYASLVTDGYPVRLSGQDSGRGTFFHRHAVLYSQSDNRRYVPLQHLHPEQSPFLVVNSLLSEEAVLGFEVGYATADPNSLVLWEAQFGDFANGAQVVIDQFISSSESKWQRYSGIVLLLPHGFEGQGPEHSSARLERYLQLTAQHNIQVCVPSTPAQIFHLLRRQMIRPYRKPLIVMSPKSLLRNPLATSTLEQLCDGEFQPLIADSSGITPASVKRLLLCSGKVYSDLAQARDTQQLSDIAIVRIEQLYPFPVDQLQRELQRYNNATKIVWAQEEPLNQGAWDQIKHRFQESLAAPRTLCYAARPPSASPAVGYMTLHLEQQKNLVAAALGLAVENPLQVATGHAPLQQE